MNEPLTLLIIGILILTLFALFFLPKKGILARKNKARRNSKRVLIEDALKHLYDCEDKGVSCTLNSIAGILSISSDAAAELAARLESMGLLRSNAGVFALTPEGKSYALRVIRIHRLWEKYLADETGIHETDWHSEAELVEHKMTQEQANILAAQMGNPIYDPHGDPIPSEDGMVPKKKGKPLSEMKPGEFGYITHIEDEPEAVYAQLVAEGLYQGMHIKMIEVSKNRIKFEAKGEECILAPLLAANITVSEMPKLEKIIDKYETLFSLKPGDSAEVLGISKACRGQQRRRLMDMGVVPGSIVKSEFSSAGGDPVAYNIRGALVALRRDQAEKIFIKVLKEEESELV